MRKTIIALVMSATGAGGALAQNSTIWSNQLVNGRDSGWAVTIPSGTSDFFNVAFATVPGIGHVPSGLVASGLSIKGVGVSVADFGTTATYPTVGVYSPNLPLDPAGTTPDLFAPIAVSTAAIATGTPLFTYQNFPAVGVIPAGDATVHAVVQFPPADAFLAVGADSNPAAAGTSGFSSDAYATPATMLASVDFGLSIGQDNGVVPPLPGGCLARAANGRLRCQRLVASENIMAGDRLETSLVGGDTLSIAFFGTHKGDLWRLFAAIGPALVAIGPVLPTIPDPDGTGSFLRINAPFPKGFGPFKFKFTAIWGNGGCKGPGAGATNFIDVTADPDPAYGVCDDGGIEGAWAVNVPSLSSDYVNNAFGAQGAAPPVVGLSVAPIDFLTAAPAFPTAGISEGNLAVDPTGNTPDVVGAGVIASFAPFTFPAGTLATTSGIYITKPVLPIVGLVNGNGWVQFPPGDPGLLGIGTDTSSVFRGCSFFSSDAYVTPGIAVGLNWGIRL